jgi:putative DNA primase/helicase
MTPTRDQILRYIEIRFSGQRITANRELKLRCPFHNDRSPSLTFNTEKGVWKCHAGCGEGGLIDFEQKLNGGTRDEARARLAEIVGAEHLFESLATKPVAVYPYVDAQGQLLFEKLRYEPKRFVQRRPLPKGGYEYRLGDVQKPLYRLPEVLTANVVMVVEGEKDADRISNLNLNERHPQTRIACTTTFDGAGKWKDRDALYFAGKKCIIVPDNDEPGKAHAEQVAQSVAKFACGVRVVNLPGLPPKGDVSDWLDAGHSADDLVAAIKSAPAWHSQEQQSHVALIEACEFAAKATPEVEWIVEGVIQKGGGGIIAGEPKVGKSLLALHLLLSVATGTNWLSFRVPRRMKCALISREDYPGLTQTRISRLRGGEAWRYDLEGWLWVNTRFQTPEFLLSNESQLQGLITEMKNEQIEFCVFDVFRRLHLADENDNSEMAKVLESLTRVQNELGCAVGLVHHLSKDVNGSLFRRIRGASAIHGWTEWALGASVVNPDEKPHAWIRKLDFETKAACPEDPKGFRVDGAGDVLRLETAALPEALGPRPLRMASSYMRGGQQ